MKVREYLFLVKWLDNRCDFELSSFLLFPNFPVALDVRTFGISGSWSNPWGKDKLIGQDNIVIELKEEYRYLLDFYVVKDDYFHGLSIDNLFNCIKLEISPKRSPEDNIKIPNELWGKKLSEVARGV